LPQITALCFLLEKSLWMCTTAMPWAERDVNAPISHYFLHFSAATIKRIWTVCTLHQPTSVNMTLCLAYVWILVNRARQLNDSTTVHMNISIGPCQHLNPPLPGRFAGSLIVIANASLPSSSFQDDEAMPIAARKIRML
jgi:hypothetical protein